MYGSSPGNLLRIALRKVDDDQGLKMVPVGSLLVPAGKVDCSNARRKLRTVLEAMRRKR